MPSHFDNTYHNIYAEPEYDTPAEKKRYEAIRAADEVLELKPARIPTRALESNKSWGERVHAVPRRRLQKWPLAHIQIP